MSGPLAALLSREVRLAVRAGGGAATGLVFFLAVVTVVPFGVGPDPRLLARIGPAILWLGALLSTLLGLDRLFQADREDGSLDLLMASSVPLELVVAVKGAAHWGATGLPLVVAAPVLGLLLDIGAAPLWRTALTLLVGTPALTALGAIGAALTVSLRRGGLLVPILVLPFGVPVLIFGVSAATALGPDAFRTPFLVLCGLSLFALVLGAVAAAAALRLGLE